MNISRVLPRPTVCLAALVAALCLGTPAVVRAQGTAKPKTTPAANPPHQHPDHGPHG